MFSESDSPLDAEHFAEQSSGALKRLDNNPDWTFYTSKLLGGQCAGGVRRLSSDTDAAHITLAEKRRRSNERVRAQTFSST